jgi:hypothetical protein
MFSGLGLKFTGGGGLRHYSYDWGGGGEGGYIGVCGHSGTCIIR